VRAITSSLTVTFGVSWTWDDERGIVALKKNYVLRDEGQKTVSKSRRVCWIPIFVVFYSTWLFLPFFSRVFVKELYADSL
jgi:hypothetical protein